MKGYILSLTESLFIIFWAAGLLRAQAPDTLWTRSIGSSSSESATAIFPTPDGGFLIGGSTLGFGSSDFYLVKTDNLGQVVWDQAYGENDRYEAMTCMISLADGNYLMAGKRAEDEPYSSYSDTYLICVDEDGNYIWNSLIGEGGVSETPSSIAQTVDGFVMTGTFWLNSSNGFDIFLRKTDTIGIEQWTTYLNFDAGKADQGVWIETAPDGGYLITGETQAFNSNYDYDAFILKTTFDGTEEWMVKYGSAWPSYEGSYRLLQASAGGYLICGYQYEDGSDKDWYVVKTNSLGAEEWHHTIGNTYHDVAFNACETADSGFAVTGNYYLNDNWNSFIVKYNSDGDTLWTKLWGDPEHTRNNYDIKQLDDGGYITLGTIKPTGGETDFYLTRLSAATTGISDHNQFTSSQIEFISVQPNPSSNSTVISYKLNSRRSVTIDLIDVTGTPLVTVLDGIVNPENMRSRFVLIYRRASIFAVSGPKGLQP